MDLNNLPMTDEQRKEMQYNLENCCCNSALFNAGDFTDLDFRKFENCTDEEARQYAKDLVDKYGDGAWIIPLFLMICSAGWGKLPGDKESGSN